MQLKRKPIFVYVRMEERIDSMMDGEKFSAIHPRRNGDGTLAIVPSTLYVQMDAAQNYRRFGFVASRRAGIF